jgi:hypothetical protein
LHASLFFFALLLFALLFASFLRIFSCARSSLALLFEYALVGHFQPTLLGLASLALLCDAL